MRYAALALGLFSLLANAGPAQAASCKADSREFNALTDQYAQIFKRNDGTPEYLCSSRFAQDHANLVDNARKRIPLARRLESCPSEVTGSTAAELQAFIDQSRASVSKLKSLCAQLASENRKESAPDKGDPQDPNQCIKPEEIEKVRFHDFKIRLVNRCKKSFNIAFQNCELKSNGGKCEWIPIVLGKQASSVIFSRQSYPKWRIR